ncbi:S8 family serine peptidase [Allorhizocola rhizosphaerae]|uniref:S8 family serine peptidase n=1 Tax=Allorhizocola rhizosphaerae TaxID=1872709 RepID=UPI000E3CFACC|nr:S8 family serine peptidase [Allorhizocola rhizosphaerae]
MRILALATATSLAVLGLAAPASAAGDGAIRDAGGPDAVPNSYIVVFKTKPKGDLTTQLAAKHAAKITHVYEAALHGFAAQMTEQEAKRVAADPRVDFVSQDQVVRAMPSQPTPPSWGLDRIDQRNRPLNANYTYTTTAPNVHAYIIDTGIRVTHVDFGGRATFDFNSAGGSNTDCNGHGTHVAGTVGGAAYGVAKGVRLHAVKVLDCNGSGTTSGVIAGVNWVTANRANPAVANMSLGGGANSALDTAVRNSINSGITYSIAAGNSGANACTFSPARVTEAVTVGASTINDARAGFSNLGGCLDIWAPGEGITSAWATSDSAANTISGTSMAAPHVAGAAALYLATNPGASAGAVRDHLVYNGSQGRLSGIGASSPNILLHSIVTPPAPGTNVLVRGQALTGGQHIRSNVGNHELVMQGDGNLVQYQGGLALWASGTQGNPGAFVIMQHDGNLVIYRSNGTAIWATNTWGTAADALVMQDDGNVVLYGPGGVVYWHK